MKTKTCGDCRWFDGEKCNAHEPPVEDNEEACSYFQRKRAKPAAPTAKGGMMGPDKEFCRTCDGFSVLGCPFRGGSLCKPERVRMPPSADRNRDDIATIALANGYVKLEPGTIQIKIEDAETLTEWFNDMVPPPWITQACERVRAALEVKP